MARFSFPVPGRSKSKQSAKPSPSNTPAGPLSKAERLLGTGGMSVDSASGLRGDTSRQWDTRSGISISVSESTASAATVDIGLGRLDEEDDETTGATGQGRRGWDIESDIIPRRLLPGKGLRLQRSAATIGNDYRTDASSLQRRQSNASTILTHYDPQKVPLSISQQTSSSAMAKGLPTKAHSLLDVDGTLSGSWGKKKKPARLDLSMLKPRSRKEQSKPSRPFLGDNNVTRSPSFMSSLSPLPNHSAENTPRRLLRSPQTPAGIDHGRPRGASDTSKLHQLYDHYEQMMFRETSEPRDGGSPRAPHVEVTGVEPTPPLTTGSSRAPSSLHTPLATPSSQPHQALSRETSKHLAHIRKSSAGSHTTIVSATSPHSTSYGLSPRKDYASSISSRNTRTSKMSRTFESDLQQNSVLSLSDSESDNGTFSDSAPKSSLSSYDLNSPDDVSISPDSRKTSSNRPAATADRASNKGKHASFAPMSEYLTIPTSGSGKKGHNARAMSGSTIRSYSSSASTATASGASGTGPTSRLSVSTTESSNRSPTSRKSAQSDFQVQEARTVSIMPVASTAEAVLSSPEDATDLLRSMSQQPDSEPSLYSMSSPDQPTPPLSPSSVEFYVRSPQRNDLEAESQTESHNARLMAVTRQEEMLLAALRQKRARMRENILAEIESEKGSSASSSGGSRDSHASSKRGSSRTSTNKQVPVETMSASGAPQLPPIQPRNSSLVSHFSNLTGRESSNRKSENSVRFADQPTISAAASSRSDPVEKRSSSAMSNATIRGSNGASRHERVLMFLDRPSAASDTAELSPNRSEFLDFDQDSDGEIIPERRSSRRASRRIAERPRAVDSNLLHANRGSGSAPLLRTQLADVPESGLEAGGRDDDHLEHHDHDHDHDHDVDLDFDGFSDVMSAAGRSDHYDEKPGIARPDSPVEQPMGLLPKGHVKGKKSAVRLSAVGYLGGYPPEAAVWGDDG